MVARTHRFSRNFVVSTLLIVFLGVILILVAPRFTGVLGAGLTEAGSVFTVAGIVGVYVEIWLLDKEIGKYTAKEVVDEVRRLSVDSGARLVDSENSMYDLGKEIAEGAKQRLVIVQRTPSLLLGPQPLEQSIKHEWDEQFTEILDAKANETIKNKNFQFFYFYSREKTLEQLRKQDLSDETKRILQKNVREKISSYKMIEKRSQHRFRIESFSVQMSGPLAVGDSNIAFWIGEKGERKERVMIAIRVQSKELTDRLFQELPRLIAATPSEDYDLLKEIGL